MFVTAHGANGNVKRKNRIPLDALIFAITNGNQIADIQGRDSIALQVANKALGDRAFGTPADLPVRDDRPSLHDPIFQPKMLSTMIRQLFQSLILLIAVSSIARGDPPHAADDASSMTLWYSQPAQRWLEALPIGNGRVGAMVFGGVADERLALNESTLWSGAPSNEHENPDGSAHLDKIRQALFADDFKTANPLINQFMLGRELNYGTNLALGDLQISMSLPSSPVTAYRRELDLPRALARVSFSAGDLKFTREYLASHPAGVLALRLSADKAGQISFVTRYAVTLPGATRVIGVDTLEQTGHAFEHHHSDGKTGVAFESLTRVVVDQGTFKPHGDAIEVIGANSATVYVAINTDYHGRDPKALCEKQISDAAGAGYEACRADHVSDVQALFNRVSLNLGSSPARDLPTDQRLSLLRKNEPDPELEAQFFQYGRYLLIAGSRADSPLPTHLQGIWNDGIASSFGWTCDMHLDINTEQNYWPAEVCNLSHCAQPLFNFVESLRAPGRITARKTYNCGGWVCHWATNAWGFTAPGWGSGWGLEAVGGAWIATHLWDHYAFTGDRQFLAQQAYPALKEAAEFFLEYLTIDPRTGYLVSGPSPSCENEFRPPGGGYASESMGCTHDRIIIFALFSECIESAKILGIDSDFRDRLEHARSKLAPFKIGKHGQLQEWAEDYDEAIPNHRHTSHLLGLYPFDQISIRDTPELAQAVRVTLDRRMKQKNWEDVEWSRANAINYYARLADGARAHESLDLLIARLSGTDLLTISPRGIAGAPADVFVVDGNEAGAAGIAEMLLQSQGGEIVFLPALPPAWPKGWIKGLCARGGFEIDQAWDNGNLTAATVRCQKTGVCRIRSKTPLRFTSQNAVVEPRHPAKDVIEMDVSPGQVLELTPQAQ